MRTLHGSRLRCLIAAITFLVPNAMTQSGSHLFTVAGEGPVAGVGDANRDGFEDFAVSEFNATAPDAVRVHSGVNGQVLHYLAFNSFSSVAGAGDVDADSHADIIVGDSTDLGNAGAAWVFSGRTGAILFLFLGAPGDRLGGSVDTAGDVNQDGYADVIVGSEADYARVFSGRDGVPLATFAGPDLGQIVRGVGDINQDGFPDVAVADRMSVTVFSGQTRSALYTISGGGPFVSSFSAIGDQDSDGFTDLALGYPFAGVRGVVEIWSGQAGAPRLVALDGVSLSFSTAQFGRAVEGIDDVDGDGLCDILVASNKYASVHSALSGATQFLSLPVSSTSRQLEIGAADLNRDGRLDVAYTNPSGRTTVVASPQVMPLESRVHELSATGGGTQRLDLNAGPAEAGSLYWIIGSATGIDPGIPLGPIHIPLNFDPYTSYTITQPNRLPLSGSKGALDANGSGYTYFRILPGRFGFLQGFTFHHAYVLYTPTGFTFASNPVPLTFVQ